MEVTTGSYVILIHYH